MWYCGDAGGLYDGAMSRDEADRGLALEGSASVVALAEEVVAVVSGRRGRAAALATVIGRGGSAPQIVGAKLLLRDDGGFVGTVGGGAIEKQVLEACRSCLRDGRSRRIKANLVRDLGMCCGGSMEVFVEYLQPQVRLFVFGAGHVSQALAPIASSAGFAVHVFDDREELLEHPAFAGVTTDNHDVDELDAALPDINERDYLLIITRDHRRDADALAGLMVRPHAYLGMIGSQRKVHQVLRRIRRRAEERGETLDWSRVHAPIGLDLGGRTPGEIAVSAVAELIKHRHGGSGDAMTIVPDVVAKLEAGDDLSPTG